MGLVFRTLSFGPISSRMHCFHAGCDGATSMFPDASDNFNLTGDYYCAAGYYRGLSPEQICAQVAPGAYVFRSTYFPFEAGTHLAGGFKTGGDRTRSAGLRVYDIHFIHLRLPPEEHFGADSNLKPPLSFPRNEPEEFDFYIGRLGKGRATCKIADVNGWDIFHLPDQVHVPNACLFSYEAVVDMIAKIGEERARPRTYAYWWLFGPTNPRRGQPRQWGRLQAQLLFQQVRTYRRWIDGRVLFADVEPPIEDPDSETWEVCADPNGRVIDPEGCQRNRAVLEGFLELVARLKDSGVSGFEFEPGVYTSPEKWVPYFGADFIPEVTIRGEPRKQPFVLWITGCASTPGVYTQAEAEEIRDRDLMQIVGRSVLGGSRAVIWQYHYEKPDFDTTLLAPNDFAPVSSSLAYNCTCGDPALGRLGFIGSCPDLDNVPVETLTIPSDGSTVTTKGYYTSGSTYRIEVSGTYRWGLCDSFYCPGGAACSYERWGDAEHLTDDCWNSNYADFFGVDISVVVDSEHVDWGPFSSDHVYSIEVNGRNAPFSFQIADCTSCYGDNAGTLTVTIYEVTP